MLPLAIVAGAASWILFRSVRGARAREPLSTFAGIVAAVITLLALPFLLITSLRSVDPLVADWYLGGVAIVALLVGGRIAGRR
jgi:hypothetical protein